MVRGRCGRVAGLGDSVLHGAVVAEPEIGNPAIIGCIAFTPLAQGMLTDRYLQGVPADSRVARGGELPQAFLTEHNLGRIRSLHEIARRRGQSLAQMALAWLLKDGRVTSVLSGASRVDQIEDSVRALGNFSFSAEELAEIDRHAKDSGVDLWARSRQS